MIKFEQLHNEAYELMYQQELPDIQSHGMVLRHKKSGARICLVSNEDNNKVFSIAFRTPPRNGTGVAHIIEHTVLCGSEKYPLKDPFIELEKGSLQTFLNAMTYPEKTVYPVASCNDKDFHNLMDVYLDAVFHPNIYKRKEIFMQEGWHYELESPEDELTINGVVYSEMKGAFSTAEEVLNREVQHALFPDTTYGQESGGDPEEIPQLTYEEYLDFHRRYYHPSNSYIYLYGDMDMAEKLAYLDEQVLQHYDYEPVDSRIAVQKPLGMRRVEVEYSVGEEESTEGRTYLAYNTIMGSALDLKRCTAWEILESVLFSCPGAPVKQALIDAGIGNDILSFYEDEILQPTLSIIAKDAMPEQEEEFRCIIEDELKRQVKEGVRKSSLLAALNSAEFRYREGDFGSYPKGLLYGLNMLSGWLHDDNAAFDCVQMNGIYEELRREVDTGYFERLIEEDLLENEHVTMVIAKPSPGLASRKEEELRGELAKYKASLSKEELERLVEETRALRTFQKTPETEEALQCIPLLELSDIKKEAEPFSNVERPVGDIPVVMHEGFTNGIAYLRLYFDVTDLPEEELPYVGMLANVLGYIDTEEHTYLDLADESSLHTGGMAIVTDTFSKSKETKAFSGHLVLRTKVLYPELPKALELIAEIFTKSRLTDTKRLREIVAEGCAKLQTTMEYGGHSMAISRAASYHSAQDYFVQKVKNLDYYRFLRRLNSEFEERKEETVAHLQKVLEYVLCKERLIVSLAAEEEGYRVLSEALPAFAETVLKSAKDVALAPSKVEPWKGGYAIQKKNEGFTYAGQVNYVARSGNYKEAGLEHTGAIRVMRTILSLDYLWNKVRVEGGAYGCMCGFAPISGTAHMVSYRDPKLSETNEVFESAAEYVEQLELTDRELTKYIIGTISGMDTPKTPKMMGDRAMNMYMTGYTLEEIQKERDEVLGATVEEIRKGAKLIRACMSQNYLCALGSESAVKKNEAMFMKVEPLGNTY